VMFRTPVNTTGSMSISKHSSPPSDPSAPRNPLEVVLGVVAERVASNVVDAVSEPAASARNISAASAPGAVSSPPRIADAPEGIGAFGSLGSTLGVLNVVAQGAHEAHAVSGNRVLLVEAAVSRVAALGALGGLGASPRVDHRVPDSEIAAVHSLVDDGSGSSEGVTDEHVDVNAPAPELVNVAVGAALDKIDVLPESPMKIGGVSIASLDEVKNEVPSVVGSGKRDGHGGAGIVVDEARDGTSDGNSADNCVGDAALPDVRVGRRNSIVGRTGSVPGPGRALDVSLGRVPEHALAAQVASVDRDRRNSVAIESLLGAEVRDVIVVDAFDEPDGLALINGGDGMAEHPWGIGSRVLAEGVVAQREDVSVDGEGSVALVGGLKASNLSGELPRVKRGGVEAGHEGSVRELEGLSDGVLSEVRAALSDEADQGKVSREVRGNSRGEVLVELARVADAVVHAGICPVDVSGDGEGEVGLRRTLRAKHEDDREDHGDEDRGHGDDDVGVNHF